MPDYIPLSDCVHAGLYLLRAPHFRLGVFDSTKSGFVGIRSKLDNEYLHTLLHWDVGPPFGTAQPLQLLQTCMLEDLSEGWSLHQEFVSNIELIDYLQLAADSYKHLM